jgi:sec-independent protein translocase protein TatC
MFNELKPHIAELRKRLMISTASIFVFFFVAFAFWQIILDWMTVPLFASLPQDSKIIFTKVPEAFFTAVKVSFFAGFIAALPVIFWQFWLFVAPGLYDNEKKLVLPFVTFATIMFISGAAFSYYIVIPFGFKFLINFSNGMFSAMPSIGEYVGFLPSF